MLVIVPLKPAIPHETMYRDRKSSLICAGVLPCFPGNPPNHRIANQLALAQGTPCLRHDAVLRVERTQSLLLETRMQLYLFNAGSWPVSSSKRCK